MIVTSTITYTVTYTVTKSWGVLFGRRPSLRANKTRSRSSGLSFHNLPLRTGCFWPSLPYSVSRHLWWSSALSLNSLSEVLSLLLIMSSVQFKWLFLRGWGSVSGCTMLKHQGRSRVTWVAECGKQTGERSGGMCLHGAPPSLGHQQLAPSALFRCGRLGELWGC